MKHKLIEAHGIMMVNEFLADTLEKLKDKEITHITMSTRADADSELDCFYSILIVYKD